MRGYGGRTRFGQRYYSGVFTAAVGQVKKSAEIKYAGMVKLADTLDLGSNAVRRAGSSPVTRTMISLQKRYYARKRLC